MLLDLGVVIDRPVDEVFAFVRDIDQQDHPDHVLNVEKTTPGPPQVGTEYRETVRMPFGRTGKMSIEITKLQAPGELSVRFAGPVMRGGIDYMLTAGDAGTELRALEQISYTGWAWPANLVGRRALHAKIRKRLDGIKAQLEV
jgi:hypothetical protein